MSESIYFNLYNDNQNPGKFLAYIDCVSNNLGRAAFSMKSEAFAEPFTINVPSRQLSVHREDSIPSVYIKYDVEPDPDMPNLIDTVAHEIFKLPRLDEVMCALRCFSKSISSFMFAPTDLDAVRAIENKELDEYVTLRFGFRNSMLRVGVESVVRTEDDYVKKHADKNGIAHFYVKASAVDDNGELVSFLFTNNHLTTVEGDEGELIPNVMSSEMTDVVPIRFGVDPDGDLFLMDDENTVDKVNKFCMSMIRESHANNNPMMFFSDNSKKAQQLKFILKQISQNSPDVSYEIIPEDDTKWYGWINLRWPVVRPKAGIYSVICNFKTSRDEVIFTEVLPNALFNMLLKDPKGVSTVYAPSEDNDTTIGVVGNFKIRRFGTTATFVEC